MLVSFCKNSNHANNKLNTNYSCFCVLLRDVNKVLASQKKQPISFENYDMFGQINQVKQFVNIIDEYKGRIFNPKSSTFQSLMMVLNQTHAWGQKREDTTIEILKKVPLGLKTELGQ